MFGGFLTVPRRNWVSAVTTTAPAGVALSTRKSILFPIMFRGSESPLVITRPSRSSGRYSSSPVMFSGSVGARTTSSALWASVCAMLTESSRPTPMLFLVYPSILISPSP